MIAAVFSLTLWFVVGHGLPSVFDNNERSLSGLDLHHHDEVYAIATGHHDDDDDQIKDADQALPANSFEFMFGPSLLTNTESTDKVAYISQPKQNEMLQTIKISEANNAILAIGRFGDFCTGTLIADNVILTAAHCIYSAGHFITGENRFYRAKDCDPDKGIETYIKQFVIHKKYADYEQTEYDFAILITTQTLLAPYLGISQPNTVMGTQIGVVGYPNTNPDGCMQHSLCHIESEPGPGIVHYPCEVQSGMSGGPVLNQNGQVIGVHSSGWDGNDAYEPGEGVLLTADRVKILLEWRNNPNSGVRHTPLGALG